MKFIILHLNYPGSHLDGAECCFRALVDGLSGRSHTCEALTISTETTLRERRNGFQLDTAGRVATFAANGATVRAFVLPPRLRRPWKAPFATRLLYGRAFRRFVSERIRAVQPDWLVIDAEHALALQRYLRPQLRPYYGRTLVLVSTGPMMTHLAHPLCREWLGQAGLLVCGSEFLRTQYLTELAHSNAPRLPPTLVSQVAGRFGSGPFPLHAKAGRGYVTLVNPCREKGVAIFLDLARALPDVPFATFASWGPIDRHALTSLPNVALFEPTEDIEAIFSRTRILLVPSVCFDGFPAVVIEAMLRGIPVVASNDGGVPEAKLGVDFVIPVKPFYLKRQPLRLFTQRRVFPANEVAPWHEAVSALLADSRLYDELSRQSRAAALRFVNGLSLEPIERFLCESAGGDAMLPGSGDFVAARVGS